MTNTSFDAIKTLRYGKSFIGNHATFKCRYKSAMAELIMKRLPKHFQRSMLCYTTSKGYTFLACIDHQQSAIWDALTSACIGAKADSLRTQADQIEYGMPIQIELPF